MSMHCIIVLQQQDRNPKLRHLYYKRSKKLILPIKLGPGQLKHKKAQWPQQAKVLFVATAIIVVIVRTFFFRLFIIFLGTMN